jgi:PAS domain-containing protein
LRQNNLRSIAFGNAGVGPSACSVGKSIHMSYGSAPTHPGDRDLVQQTLDRASEARADFDEVKESCGCSSRLCDFEHRLLMPDGSVKHLHVSARALTTLSGDREFVGAVTDITAAKQAAEKSRQDERELRRITDAIPRLIIVYGPDGRRSM